MRRLLPLALLPVAATPLCLAQGELLKVTASDGAAAARFGSSASVSGARILAGAPNDGELGIGAGAAYLFDLATGVESFKLLASDGAPGAYFGGSVAHAGDLALVGAWGAESAYAFDAATGGELHVLTATGGASGDGFGWSVDVAGGLGIVGADLHDAASRASGAAYVFDLATGQQLHELCAADGQTYDGFGYAVAISGERALVGAWGDDDLGNVSGSAYLFDLTTGQQLFKLTASDGETGDRFGISVALEGERAVIGAYTKDGNETNSGVAYVFDVSTGQELLRLEASHEKPFAAFGASVDLHGGRVLVGASGDNENGYEAGAAYVFELATGEQLFKLTASDAATKDRFGTAVGLAGDRAVVSAPRNGELGEDAGALYVFEAAIGSSYCTANANSTGLPAAISAYGSTLVAEGFLVVTCGQLPANRFAYFLVSGTQGFVANPGGSQGNLCLGGSIGRYTHSAASTGDAGSISLAIDLGALPLSPPVAVQPGETWNWQLWYRDKNPTATSNFSDGLAVTFR